jgi:hypothetical protein
MAFWGHLADLVGHCNPEILYERRSIVSSGPGAFTLEPISAPDFYRDMDCHRRLEHWRLDVQRCVGLADDESQSRPIHCIVGAGGNDAANIPGRDSGGSACPPCALPFGTRGITRICGQR